MKFFRLLTLAASLLLGFACSQTDDENRTGRLMILRWDHLPTQFELSDAYRIEVTTALGTQQCNIGCGRMFYLADADAPIESVRVHFADSGVILLVDGSHASVSGNVLSITLDMSDVTLVYDRATLDAVRNNLAGNYLQIADIDLSVGGNWTPIGDNFTGTYDGGGFAIRDMTVNVTGSMAVSAGLFGTNSGTLRNIHIEGGSVNGTATDAYGFAYCGGVCGLNNSGTITACSNSASVNGTATNINGCAYCGGVCGRNDSGTITASSNSGSVSGDAKKELLCGGVCGLNYGTITECVNSASVSGTGSQHAVCGGVCGENSSTISACTNSGEVSGTATDTFVYCGGVCGANGGTISACTNSGEVSGESQKYALCGGVCGENGSNGTITACSNSGSVSGTATGNTAQCGGMCGYNNGTITACSNTASVSGAASQEAQIGGVSGYNGSNGTITACSNSGEVSGTASQSAPCGGVCGWNNSGTITYCYWGGASADLSGIRIGTTTGATKFGDGTNGTGWPETTMPGWGGTAPDSWDAPTLGAWANPWESLGSWNGGANQTFPTLKSPN